MFRSKNDLLSGLTVALALVPEAVAFAFIAGVSPLVGLYAAFFVCLITGIFGGRPGMISGATGALAVVMVSLVATHGVEYLFAAVILMGIIQILAGLLKLGKFARVVPYPVMLGFVNGLAIVIFLAQMAHFKVDGQWMHGTELITMLTLVILTMAIIYILPKITKAIPSSLAAIITVTLIVKLLHIDTKSVLDLASIKGGLPTPHLPIIPLNLETLKIILPYSLTLAAVGLIESLMTLQLIDEITETRGKMNKECAAQGLANIITGLFGGMGGCAMIGQSMINVKSGGRKRLSSIAAALFLLFFIVVSSKLIEQIPIAALTGVMMMVVISTFEWSSLRILRKIPKSDAFVLILVSTITVFTDLATGVALGVITSALVFAWKKSQHIKADISTQNNQKLYSFNGPLFFGSIKTFQELLDIKNDPPVVHLDFRNSQICDHSAIEAIQSTMAKYQKLQKQVYLKNLSPNCRTILQKASATVEKNVLVN
ncbi:MAG: Bicarbonate transporter BicA [Chlamydiales bacterium]|nr:Bicarbonate transporter BicA [Chlamydiales bacterium]MCH9636053.1 Bicarbonate transporter BicA [Chlamydiales bacterium]MCH9703998.1 SulP family inorganic anion transporter [Chlamydiota bacterium]